MAYCTKCGQVNAEGDTFCAKCGASFGAAGSASAPMASTATPETSGKAVASLICGLLFFFFPAAVVAIVCGHMSLAEIRKSAGRLHGHGMALAGLILGYLGVAFIPIILIVAAIAIPNLLRSRMAANEAAAVGALREMNVAEVTYASTYNNGFTPSLGGQGGGAASCDNAQLLDSTLSGNMAGNSSKKSGYNFTYAPGKRIPKAAPECSAAGADSFTINAEPVARGTTGQRSFFTDESGVIRFEMNGPATVESSPIS